MHCTFPKFLLAAVCALAFSAPATADPFDLLYVFKGAHDGGAPYSALTPDGQGNFYGTTWGGGTKACGCGTVFRISADGTFITVYAFKGGKDGAGPLAGVTFGPDGALYGTTGSGGDSGTPDCVFNDCGTVFRVKTDGSEKVLHRFGGTDGKTPFGSVILDAKGNIFGTTEFGGGDDFGTVYKITPDGKEQLLHAFRDDGHDGNRPTGKLAMDKSGNLYGATIIGGSKFRGTIFKVTPEGDETILHAFRGDEDGDQPSSDLTIDRKGNLYGTTKEGGGANDSGTIFMLTPDGVKTVLYNFQGGTDGAYPLGGVIADSDGNLYGTTSFKGASAFGTAYKLAPDGAVFVLHSFTRNKDGGAPDATLASDGLGSLYGTAHEGGSFKRQNCSSDGCGTVFRLTP